MQSGFSNPSDQEAASFFNRGGISTAARLMQGRHIDDIPVETRGKNDRSLYIDR